jgi:hypothetical protein
MRAGDPVSIDLSSGADPTYDGMLTTLVLNDLSSGPPFPGHEAHEVDSHTDARSPSGA